MFKVPYFYAGLFLASYSFYKRKEAGKRPHEPETVTIGQGKSGPHIGIKGTPLPTFGMCLGGGVMIYAIYVASPKSCVI